MTQTYKRLGATASSGVISAADVLYTASSTSGDSTVISTITICNRSSSAQTYRLCVNGSAAFADAGYLVFGATVDANDSIFLTLGVTLDSTNRYLMCSSSSTDVSFSAFGVENS